MNVKQRNEHYVNNAKFSQAVVEYVQDCNKSKKKKQETPIVPDYVAECFLKIAEGLSHKSNFVRYTYREEMVMDAVENCLRAIRNYDIDAATRTGKPNAFSYFTQISWFAFLRRINKEKKQQEIKEKLLSSFDLNDFLVSEEEDPESSRAIQSFVDELRKRIDDVKEKDHAFDRMEEVMKKISRRRNNNDSDISDFFETTEL